VRVEELRPGMVFTPSVPGMPSMIFITQSRHPLWPGLQLVVWRGVDDDQVIFDALDARQVLEGRVHEVDRETQMAWLRRGVLGRRGSEAMVTAIAEASDVDKDRVREIMVSAAQAMGRMRARGERLAAQGRVDWVDPKTLPRQGWEK
jgi:hypothetical protein